jgi:hypothetical protein
MASANQSRGRPEETVYGGSAAAPVVGTPLAAAKSPGAVVGCNVWLGAADAVADALGGGVEAEFVPDPPRGGGGVVDRLGAGAASGKAMPVFEDRSGSG